MNLMTYSCTKLSNFPKAVVHLSIVLRFILTLIESMHTLSVDIQNNNNQLQNKSDIILLPML